MTHIDWLVGLQTEFAKRRIMGEYFPMLTRFGLADTDVAIHSHMLTYLATVGQHLGFAGISECPLPVGSGRLALLGDVRADALWFDKQRNVPVAAFEFERFQTRSDESKLRHKIENLAITCLRAGNTLQHCFLIYWLRSGIAPHSLREAQTPYESGFVRNGVRVPSPNCPLTIIKCVFGRRGQKLLISDMLFVETGLQNWHKRKGI